MTRRWRATSASFLIYTLARLSCCVIHSLLQCCAFHVFARGPEAILAILCDKIPYDPYSYGFTDSNRLLLFSHCIFSTNVDPAAPATTTPPSMTGPTSLSHLARGLLLNSTSTPWLRCSQTVELKRTCVDSSVWKNDYHPTWPVHKSLLEGTRLLVFLFRLPCLTSLSLAVIANVASRLQSLDQVLHSKLTTLPSLGQRRSKTKRTPQPARSPRPLQRKPFPRHRSCRLESQPRPVVGPSRLRARGKAGWGMVDGRCCCGGCWLVLEGCGPRERKRGRV
jgi:hypothetical protein